MAQFRRGIGGEVRTGAPQNSLSFDVEDYFQVAALVSAVDRKSWDAQPARVDANTARLLELLARRGVRATFFVLGWIAEQPNGKPGSVRGYARYLDGSPDGMAFTQTGDLLVVTGLHEMIYRVRPNGMTDVFLEDRNAEKLIAPANAAFGGMDLDELYITNLLGNSVSRIKGVPRGQPLYHQV